MARVRVPHLSTPMRLSGDRLSANEQNTDEEIVECVEAILRTPLGSRETAPELGLPALEFLDEDEQLVEIVDAILKGEPRAGEVQEEAEITLAEEYARAYLVRIEGEES